MTDVVDMKEEGEIESDEEQDEVYKKIDRPQLDVRVDSIGQERYNTDSTNSSDSDGETPHKFMKRLEKPPQATATSAPKSKNGSLWGNMLQEETLMENLKTCDVSTRKRKFERGAESYDFESHRKDEDTSRHRRALPLEPNDLSYKLAKRRKMEISGNDSSSSNGSAKSNKRARKNCYKQRKLKASKILPDIEVPLDGSDEEFGQDMAQKLEEEKSDLIVNVVHVIGKEASLNLYKITQKIELEGGMLTMNKNRRRTPGGIFLFLLKTSDKIDEDKKSEIFDSDKKRADKGIADRKLSSEQTEAKDPPNSPANAEFIESNGKITDPDLVFQKILNFSNPKARPPQISEDILDIDNYGDMDTF